MGYDYRQRFSDEEKFFMSSEQVSAFKAAHPEMIGEDGWLGGMDWGFYISLTERGEGTALIKWNEFDSPRWDSPAEFLDALAPYVQDGSFIEFQGDDDTDFFRFVFGGGKVVEYRPEITWKIK